MDTSSYNHEEGRKFNINNEDTTDHFQKKALQLKFLNAREFLGNDITDR